MLQVWSWKRNYEDVSELKPLVFKVFQGKIAAVRRVESAGYAPVNRKDT